LSAYLQALSRLHVKSERRTKIGALDVRERVGHALDISYVSDRDFSPLFLQALAAAIFPMRQGTDATQPRRSFRSAPVTMILGLVMRVSFSLV